jgi:hypothetical protein
VVEPVARAGQGGCGGGVDLRAGPGAGLARPRGGLVDRLRQPGFGAGQRGAGGLDPGAGVFLAGLGTSRVGSSAMAT